VRPGGQRSRRTAHVGRSRNRAGSAARLASSCRSAGRC
jgi:hypothetical protein